MPNKDIEKLKEKLTEIAHVRSALSIFEWDMSVNMPEQAAEIRGQNISYFVSEAHNKLTSKEFSSLLRKLKKDAENKKLSLEDAAIVREVWRDYEKEIKLPAEFLKELSEATTNAHYAWVNARKKSDFGLFAPHLEKIVRLKRKQAKHYGYTVSPYDPLLDDMEPGLSAETASLLFDELKKFLVPLIGRIKKSRSKPSPKILIGHYPLGKQKEFGTKVLSKIGFDFLKGRIDQSAHPFASGFHPTDVRLTTRFSEENLMYSVTSSIHEAGHGMYEQGLDPKHWENPLGTAMSLGIHESQSRLWENQVGRGMPFWEYFYPILRKEFPKPFGKIKLNDFYEAINAVEPTLIRTEADEVTYNLHIIIRFEIEKELIEGTIDVSDLPKIWSDKYKSYFGIKVPNDAVGVLQDVHWSAGLFGYFPSYTLGNLNAAQLYAAAKRQVKNLEREFERGNFAPLKRWLNSRIHGHGRFYSAEDLIRRATGEPLAISYYTDYIERKYQAIYNL